jgi:hypothetical protein
MNVHIRIFKEAHMKKTTLFLSAAGIGAGVVCTLAHNRRKKRREEIAGEAETKKANGKQARGNGRCACRFVDAHRNERNAGVTSRSINESAAEEELDDNGTDQEEAAQILRAVRDEAFDSSDEKLALVLGRPIEEIREWIGGSRTIDGDVLMKARALAMQRGLEI